MPISDFLDSLGANDFDGVSSAQDKYYEYNPVTGKVKGSGGLTEREGTEILASFLKGQIESGALSDASVNPAITGYLNSVGVNERRRQSELLAYLSNSGLSQASARAAIAEDDVRGDRELSSALAGFRDQLQGQRYQALSGLASYAAEESAAERDAALAEIWRQRQRRDQAKDRRRATASALLVPLAGYTYQGGIQAGLQQQQNASDQQSLNAILGALNNNQSPGFGQSTTGTTGAVQSSIYGNSGAAPVSYNSFNTGSSAYAGGSAGQGAGKGIVSSLFGL